MIFYDSTVIPRYATIDTFPQLHHSATVYYYHSDQIHRLAFEHIKVNSIKFPIHELGFLCWINGRQSTRPRSLKISVFKERFWFAGMLFNGQLQMTFAERVNGPGLNRDLLPGFV